MVFKHNKQPFANDDPCQFGYKQVRRLDCGGQLALFTGVSSFRGNPGKHPISEGEGVFSRSLGEVGDAYIPNDIAPSALDNDFSMSWFTSGTSEVVRSEHGKRSFSVDRSDEDSSKRIRQADHDSIVGLSATSSEGLCKPVVGVELDNRKDAAVVSEDPARHISSSTLSLPFVNTCTTEDSRLEPPVRFSLFPVHFEDGLRTTGLHLLEENYYPVFDHPRKHVPVGPNHQADIPVWRSHGSKNSFEEYDDCGSSTSATYLASAGHPIVDEDNSDKWMGTSVILLPDSDSSTLDVRLGNRKTECSCLDEGSIRCVRQHVMEAREKLKKTLGLDKFIELGFNDMGEVVAQKWTEEEEQLFHEVVLSNPASLGKNFWDDLPCAFPSLSSKELVSYYFNVFMLRKRAEQNRSDPMNVDSDNDEWQDSDGEFTTTEEDEEDSVVESPADQDDSTFNNDGHAEADIHEDAEDGDDSDDYANAVDDGEELCGVSEGCISEKLKFAPKVQPVDKYSQDVGEEQDAQDDSCTSYDGQSIRVPSYGGSADLGVAQDSLMEHGGYINDHLCRISDHEYIGGPFDTKTWEISCIHGTEKDVDFLPTSNVIEEFGNGSWEN